MSEAVPDWVWDPKPGGRAQLGEKMQGCAQGPRTLAQDEGMRRVAGKRASRGTLDTEAQTR